MARLDVEVRARWAGGTPDFTHAPILVAVSVSAADGSPVTGLTFSEFVVRCLQAPGSGTTTVSMDGFEEHSTGGPAGSGGYYSFVVRPSAEGVELPFVQDEVFLFVTVRGGGDDGQTLCLARYHVVTHPG
jgi:hypothetical protein